MIDGNFPMAKDDTDDDYFYSQHDFEICEMCKEQFEESKINEYGLCPDCEREFQKEKESIEETQQSLNNQFG